MFEELDKYLKGIEEALKLPEGVTSRQMVPEIVARITEIPIDLVAQDIVGQKIMKLVLGVILSVAPQHIGPAVAARWSKRDTEDVYAIAKEFLVEGTDPTADDLVKVANAIKNLRQGIAFGDWSRIYRSFGVKDFETIKTEWENVARSFASAFAIELPSAGMPPSPSTSPPPTQALPIFPPVTIEIPGFG